MCSLLAPPLPLIGIRAPRQHCPLHVPLASTASYTCPSLALPPIRASPLCLSHASCLAVSLQCRPPCRIPGPRPCALSMWLHRRSYCVRRGIHGRLCLDCRGSCEQEQTKTLSQTLIHYRGVGYEQIHPKPKARPRPDKINSPDFATLPRTKSP